MRPGKLFNWLLKRLSNCNQFVNFLGSRKFLVGQYYYANLILQIGVCSRSHSFRGFGEHVLSRDINVSGQLCAS